MSRIFIDYTEWLVKRTGTGLADLLLLLALLAEACGNWPIRADWVSGREGLKETESQTEGEYRAAALDSM